MTIWPSQFDHMIEVIEAKNVANGAALPFMEEVGIIADIRGRNEVE